jgi:hypothetical protein
MPRVDYSVHCQATVVSVPSMLETPLSREFVEKEHTFEERGLTNAKPGEAEYMVRLAQTASYELSPEPIFLICSLGTFAAVGTCGGYGRFTPGASLPCHIHKFDDSITIVDG